MALWPQYLERVHDFDGSQEWEEAAIVLSLLQAVRNKNQLFNVKLAEKRAAEAPREPKPKDIRPCGRAGHGVLPEMPAGLKKEAA